MQRIEALRLGGVGVGAAEVPDRSAGTGADHARGCARWSAADGAFRVGQHGVRPRPRGHARFGGELRWVGVPRGEPCRSLGEVQRRFVIPGDRRLAGVKQSVA